MNVDPSGLSFTAPMTDPLSYSINNTLNLDFNRISNLQFSFERATSNYLNSGSIRVLNNSSDYENYLVGNFRENVAHVLNVGIIDAYTAKNIAQESLKNAQNSGLSGQHNGMADAYRHCQWSCEMGKQLGVKQAKEIGETHELYGGGPLKEVYMDTFNNTLGRQMSLRPESCKTNCMKLVEKNILQLDDKKPKKR